MENKLIKAAVAARFTHVLTTSPPHDRHSSFQEAATITTPVTTMTATSVLAAMTPSREISLPVSRATCGSLTDAMVYSSRAPRNSSRSGAMWNVGSRMPSSASIVL